jgi:hypothetical protein
MAFVQLTRLPEPVSTHTGLSALTAGSIAAAGEGEEKLNVVDSTAVSTTVMPVEVPVNDVAGAAVSPLQVPLVAPGVMVMTPLLAAQVDAAPRAPGALLHIWIWTLDD